MRMVCLLVLMILFYQHVSGQSPVRISREFVFVNHLMGRGELNEALYVLGRISPSDLSGRDSLHYLRGSVLFQQKELLPAAINFLSVSAASPVFHKALFFGAYSLAHGGQAGSARSVLHDVALAPGTMRAGMQNFQLGGISLLERDMDAFDRYAARFDGSHHAFALEEQSMLGHAERMRTYRQRSPFVAGALSAALPGLGKVYSGRTAEGIAGFLYVAAMSAVAYDFYRGSGPQSAWFIISATVAGTFYIGNIWGSAVTARRQNQIFNHEMDQRILFDLHIPLRNAYN